MIKTKLKNAVCLLVVFNLPVSTLLAEETSIEVHASQVSHPLSRYLTGACIEDVNHEIYGGIYSQMIYGESFAEPPRAGTLDDGVSGMWRPLRPGAAEGGFSLESANPFSGVQSQRITFAGGTGEIGIENQGLDHWGMNFTAGKIYEGLVWVRSEKKVELFVALAGRDSGKVYAEKKLAVAPGDWQRLEFTLKPKETDKDGAFAIKLKRPGSVVIGYAFLQPGEWGRFRGLPVRKDVAEALVNQGITVLRMGGSMVNTNDYHWKHMIGPRDRRLPYHGFWHPFSSDGWGIIDFLNFCEAAGFAGVPDFNLNETPQDMADFIEYANGPKNSPWGARRAADGHSKPYHLKYVELGNEEQIDHVYFQKFKLLAEAIWAKDTNVILVVAGGGPADQSILQLARQHDCEVWFDAHIWTDGPRPDFGDLWNFMKSLNRLADGAKHHVVIFELNAAIHSQRRALGNAGAIIATERSGQIPVVCSANCLQPDGRNDNGWDQGLLFLNPSQVWLQPPGYVTRMISQNYEPLLVKSEIQNAGTNLDAAAVRSDDGKTLVLQVVNFSGQNQVAAIRLDGFAPVQRPAKVEELAGSLDAQNTAGIPDCIMPAKKEWQPEFASGDVHYTFPPHSFTIIKFN